MVEGLQWLLDKNLIQQAEGVAGESRFRMLETIREYAYEQLAASGDQTRLRQWHARYYTALAEKTEPLLRTQAQRRWMEQLELEHDNLRATFQWYIESDNSVAGLRLGGALWRFWAIVDRRRGAAQDQAGQPLGVAQRVLLRQKAAIRVAQQDDLLVAQLRAQRIGVVAPGRVRDRFKAVWSGRANLIWATYAAVIPEDQHEAVGKETGETAWGIKARHYSVSLRRMTLKNSAIDADHDASALLDR